MKYDFALQQFVEETHQADKIAVAGSNGEITWAELKKLTLQLCEQFKALALPQGHPVLIYGHKEYLYPAAILACMHANIPYVPVDKIYPIERIKKIVAITGSQVLVCCSYEIPVIDMPAVIDFNLNLNLNFQPDYTDKIYGDTDDPLRYIMFTSGSTGEPKGVQISKNAVQAYVTWALNDFGFTSSDVFMNQAPFTFDVSLSDVLHSFALGATLVLNAADLAKDQEAFLARLTKFNCSVWTSTPSFAYLFLRNSAFTSNALTSLSSFLFIGEELPNRTVGILKSNFPKARVINAYGPTEATIITTFIEIDAAHLKLYPNLPIGYAMPGSELLIEKINPNDKEGELIIVGDHVSQGYFKNEELNSQKFFVYNKKRAFKTGDLAYYENDLLFFIGRNDEQIKLNGFRIELTEISNALLKNSSVLDAVSVALKRNREVKKIISFVIPRQGQHSASLKAELMKELETALPYYMLPGDIVQLAEFPYSASHKIDKNKLIDTYLQSI
jgi:D-alanine--poly(phosphoribitol) ligase subunit 1